MASSSGQSPSPGAGMWLPGVGVASKTRWALSCCPWGSTPAHQQPWLCRGVAGPASPRANFPPLSVTLHLSLALLVVLSVFPPPSPSPHHIGPCPPPHPCTPCTVPPPLPRGFYPARRRNSEAQFPPGRASSGRLREGCSLTIPTSWPLPPGPCSWKTPKSPGLCYWRGVAPWGPTKNPQGGRLPAPCPLPPPFHHPDLWGKGRC